MTQDEYLKIISESEELDEPVVYVGSTAYHKNTELSREWGLDELSPELFRAFASTDEYFIGRWVEGLSVGNLVFPKKDTRAPTERELKLYN